MIRQTRLYKSVKTQVKKNQKLYTFLKYAKNSSDAEMQKLVLAKTLPREYCDSITILAEHPGQLYPDRLFYDLSMNSKMVGFFALMRILLELLDFADRLGLTPIVRWGSDIAYYDHGMDGITQNVYEYYFEQPSGITQLRAEDCRNVFRCDASKHRGYFLRYGTTEESYKLDDAEITNFAAIYRKHIRLNQKTQSYIDNELKNILNAKKTLGVHVRGTDYNIGLENHPNVILPGEYLKKAQDMFEKGGYEQVFLATDDLSALRLFQDAFGNSLVYYQDAMRSESDAGIGIQGQESSRPLHHYKLGLEVLRDVYTLASCDGLLSGLSHVAFAARYINIAMGKEFVETSVLNKGVKEEEHNMKIVGGGGYTIS